VLESASLAGGLPQPTPLRRIRSLSTYGQDSIQHLIGDAQILLGLKGRQRVQVPFPDHLVRQLPRDRRIHTEEIVQGIAVLDLGEASNHEQPGILPAEELDPADPIQKRLTLCVGWLLLGIGRRHVVGLHIGGRLLPPFCDGRLAGMAERRLKIDAPFLLILAVATNAVGFDEGGDALLKGLLGVGLKRGEISTTPRLRHASPCEQQQESTKGLT